MRMLRRFFIALGRAYPRLVNPMWSFAYPLLFRKNEYHAGENYEGSRQEVFERIYSENLWHSLESKSGDGSSLVQTKLVRAALPRVLARVNGTVIFDAPCGDFHWMQHVRFSSEIKYIGADLVRPLIDKLQNNFGNAQRSFEVRDIVEQPALDCDLWLCRDVLFHLPMADIVRILTNIDPTKTRYLLTTTYPWVRENRDVKAGGFRFINLEIPPFSLPRPELRIDDFIVPEPPRVLALWRAELIAASMRKN